MAKDNKFKAFAGKVPGIVGDGLQILDTIAGVFQRKPSVRQWSQDKRKAKIRLRSQGLSGSELRQGVRNWVSNNPRPKGSDLYNPVDLGRSNGVRADAQGNIGTFAGAGTTTTKKAGVNPLIVYVVLGYVGYLLLKQFKFIK